METMRLRAIQQPSRVEALLESFASSRGLLPADAYPVGGAEELTPELRTRVINMRQEDHVWRAWTDDRHVWFLSGELSLALSRERGRPVLHIRRYAEDGQLQDSGVWLQVQNRTWEQLAG